MPTPHSHLTPLTREQVFTALLSVRVDKDMGMGPDDGTLVVKPSSLSTTRQRVRFSAVPPQFLPMLLATLADSGFYDEDVITLAGSTKGFYDAAVGINAQFYYPSAVAIDPGGTFALVTVRFARIIAPARIIASARRRRICLTRMLHSPAHRFPLRCGARRRRHSVEAMCPLPPLSLMRRRFAPLAQRTRARRIAGPQQPPHPPYRPHLRGNNHARGQHQWLQ